MRKIPAMGSASVRRSSVFRRLLPRLAVLCCAACVSNLALAKGMDSWFRVELLAFAYQDSAASAEESWPTHPPLYYPASLVRLSSPEIAEMRRVLPLIAGADRGRKAIPRTTLSADMPLDHAWVMPLPAAQGMVRWGDREEVLAETPILGVGLPFVLRPPHSLDRLSRRIAQAEGYRVLFRGTWHQPIEENEAATHILVRGGDVYGRHRELEGSIAIYRKRFVHVDTNLWFSSFVPTVEAPPESPQLPPPPQTLFLSTAFLEEEISVPQVESQVTPAAQPALGQRPPWVQAEEQEGKQTRPEEARRAFREFVRELPSSSSVESPQFAEEDADFAVRRVVVLRQSGRVQNRRSYYFDHPLLGVVVHIVQLH